MPTRPTVHIGDQPTITTTFKVNGVPTSPSTVTARYRKPDGTEAAVTPSAGGTGIFVTTLPAVDQSGQWWWRVKGTAGVIAADEGYFVVEQTPFASP